MTQRTAIGRLPPEVNTAFAYHVILNSILTPLTRRLTWTQYGACFTVIGLTYSQSIIIRSYIGANMATTHNYSSYGRVTTNFYLCLDITVFHTWSKGYISHSYRAPIFSGKRCHSFLIRATSKPPNFLAKDKTSSKGHGLVSMWNRP